MCGVTTIQVGNIVYEKLTNGSLVPVGEVSTNGQGDTRLVRPDWAKVDLAPVLQGADIDRPPEVCARTDGTCLFYRGKVNAINAEPEALKTWLGLHACVQQMGLGQPAMFVDFEDTARTVVARLRALGATDEMIETLFVYVRPDTPATSEIVADLPGLGATVAVIDGITEAMTLHGLDLKDNADIARFADLLPRPLARMGVAVIEVDHVAKSRESRGRWALGGQHKLSAIDGVAYSVEMVRPFGRGMTGLAKLTVSKDRPGHVRPASAFGKTAGEIHLDSDPIDGSVRIRIEPVAATEQGEVWRPTRYMQKVSVYLERAGEQTINAVRRDLKGRAEYVTAAIHQLVAEGFVARRDGPKNSVLVSSIKPYREDEG